MAKLPKFPKLGLDFLLFLLTFMFASSLIYGDFWNVFDWSSPGAAGTALPELVYLVGTFFFVKNILLPFLKKRKP